MFLLVVLAYRLYNAVRFFFSVSLIMKINFFPLVPPEEGKHDMCDSG